MSGARGSAGAFRPTAEPGSPADVYALKRRRWREGVERFLRGGRLVLLVEPTPEAVTKTSIEGEAA